MPNPYYSTTVPPGGFTFLNYKNNVGRNSLRNTYSKILKLRTATNNAYLNTFVTNNLNFDLTGAFKWQILQSNDLRIVVIGNFNVVQQSGSVNFPVTGTWQVYTHNIPGTVNLSAINSGLTSTTLNVNNTNQNFNNLPPGTFMIFLDRTPQVN
jgi:hypothetical protein